MFVFMLKYKCKYFQNIKLLHGAYILETCQGLQRLQEVVRRYKFFGFLVFFDSAIVYCVTQQTPKSIFHCF